MSGASASGQDDLLLIGTIGLPFGIRGQVKLHIVTSHPEHLQRIKTVYVGEDQRPMELRQALLHKHNLVILKLAGIDDRNTAETLRGAEVSIRETDALPLDEDEYFLHDLPGLAVETTTGETVGKVKEVLETGANEVLVVTRVGGGEVLIPMIHDVVKVLDIAAQRIVIEPMPGLLDDQ